LALPAAESPSTKYISDSAGFLDWQSASFPGRDAPSNAPLRMIASLAALAAKRARAANNIFQLWLWHRSDFLQIDIQTFFYGCLNNRLYLGIT